MIKHTKRWSLLFTTWLLFSSSIWADNNKIAQWTKQVLLSTLSVNYLESDNEVSQLRGNYTLNAWNGIYSFLGNYLDKVHAKRLFLHPIANHPPTITDAGRVHSKNLFPNMPYWRVDQSISIPELQLNIVFSALVICSAPEKGKCLIQSISMIKKVREVYTYST